MRHLSQFAYLVIILFIFSFLWFDLLCFVFLCNTTIVIIMYHGFDFCSLSLSRCLCLWFSYSVGKSLKDVKVTGIFLKTQSKIQKWLPFSASLSQRDWDMFLMSHIAYLIKYSEYILIQFDTFIKQIYRTDIFPNIQIASLLCVNNAGLENFRWPLFFI